MLALRRHTKIPVSFCIRLTVLRDDCYQYHNDIKFTPFHFRQTYTLQRLISTYMLSSYYKYILTVAPNNCCNDILVDKITRILQ